MIPAPMRINPPPTAEYFRRVAHWLTGASSLPEIEAQDVQDADDVRYLQPLLFLVPLLSHARVIVEIGTDDGSTVVPLLYAAALTGGHVTSIDPAPCPRAYDVVRRNGLTNFWTMRHEPSADVLRTWQGPIDFALVDGAHAYQAVVDDLVGVLAHLAPGGFVALHDWYMWFDAGPDPTIIPRDHSGEAVTAGTPRAVQDVMAMVDPDEFGMISFAAAGIGPLPFDTSWPGIGCALIGRRQAIEVDFRRRYAAAGARR